MIFVFAFITQWSFKRIFKVIFLIIHVFFFFVILVFFVEFSVPYFLNFLNFFFAKFEPIRHFGTFFDSTLIFVIISRTWFVIQSLLGNVPKLECNLNNLTHIHARCRMPRVKIKTSLSLKLFFDKVLECGYIFLIKGLLEGIENQNCLLMRDWTEWERIYHVKHCLDHFSTQAFTQYRRCFNWTSFSKS